MCAGAIHWGNVRRVVYALGSDRFYASIGPAPDMLVIPCREVFARAGRPVEVVGPALEDEALAVHADFWRS
jgi:tRNA(Arg) A34 adenosine deaminase TadA